MGKSLEVYKTGSDSIAERVLDSDNGYKDRHKWIEMELIGT